MKKLLTILVSAASACFAFADDAAVFTESGTSFGDTTVNATEGITFDITAGDAELANTENKDKRFWYSLASGTDADYGIITNYESNTASTPIASRPGMWANVANKNYLKLDTSDTLFRSIDGMNAENTAPKTVNIGGGIYFDSLVQFTVTEDDVTPTTGDKLVVWLKAVEGTEDDPGSTNLVITAGNGEEDNKAVPGNFVVSSDDFPIEPNSWHRLTIKAFVNNNSTFFNVYIDGAPVTGVLNGELNGEGITDFASLVSAAEELLNPTTISAVGFKGTGAVDDLAFTTSDPLGFSVTATIVDEDKTGAFAKYSVDGSTWLALTSGSEFTVPASTTKITFKVYTWDNYELEGGTITSEIDSETQNIAWIKEEQVSKDAANITLTVKEAQDEPEPATPFSITIAGETTAYATLAEAIANANGAAEAGATIKLTADATVAEWLKVDKNVVLDLNGCTLTEQVNPAAGTDYGAIYVRTTCQLTITDSSNDKNGKIASNGDIVIGNYGTVIVEAGTIESGEVPDKDVSIYNMNYAGTQVGTANIDGGKVESVWNCGTITVAADASVDYLDNSGKATIATGATVGNVVLMDGKDAQGVVGAGTITAPDGLAVESGVEGYNVAYNDGVYSLAAVTYTITVETIANATAKVYVNEVELTGGVVAGTEYTVVVTPAQDYEYVVAPEGWTKVDNTITKTGTVADANVTITVAAPTEIVITPTEPTIGGVEVEFDNSGVITNITTAADGKDVSGVADADINAFLDRFEECYTVSVAGGKLSIALNDAAKPVIGEGDVNGDKTEEPAVQIVDGQFKVTIQDSFKSLKYKLQYKADLANDWADVDTTEAGTKGGAMQLSAPVDGPKGFYRVVVTE